MYRFGDHVLDTARRELRRGGARVALEPQVFDLIVYLVASRERVVTRDDLIADVWGGRIVSDSTLASRINAARKALGDSGERQIYIRTIARKGLRFVGEVETDLVAPPPFPAPAAGLGSAIALLTQSLRQSAVEVEREGAAYPGIYILWRQAFGNTGKLYGDILAVWREGNRLRFRHGTPSTQHAGEVLILRHQVYFVGEDDQRVDGLYFLLLNGVSGRSALRLDGIETSVFIDRGRTPAAGYVVAVRLRDPAGEGPPEASMIEAIHARILAHLEAGMLEDLAGPEVVAEVRRVIGVPRPDGDLDRVLRAPASRSLSAADFEGTPGLMADISRLRRALLETEVEMGAHTGRGFRAEV